jgi:hypothetical protein
MSFLLEDYISLPHFKTIGIKDNLTIKKTSQSIVPSKKPSLMSRYAKG